ncbi:MAG: hypothetical protein QOE90_2673 [Thermoplasmata archaeon]|jgi:DNA-binding transcriptional ArsR family regulator|nr:hypothetical protein [Thermoplasmata archaeon]
MRILTLALLVAATLAIPAVLAREVVTIQAPDEGADVHGTSAAVDTTQYVQDAPGVTTSVQTRDVHTHAGGGSCRLDSGDTTVSQERAQDACQPGEVQTDAAPDAVGVDVHVLLPAAPAPPAPPAGPAQSQSTLVIPVEQMSRTALVAAAAAGVSVLALYGVWRALKLTGLAALLPLYSHLSDDEILDDSNRSAIFRLIQQEPGISTKDIADRLGLAWGTVTHHLAKLEKRRFVVSKKYGKYRRFFANGEGGSHQKDALAVLRVDRTGDVAALIRASPGMTQKAVSQALGVSSSTILWHVKRLEEVQLVTKVREGKLVRYYPAEGLGQIDLIPAAHVANAA